MNFFKFIASLDISNQKAVVYLSSESQTQNQKTKSQMMVSLGENKESNTEKIWEEPGFFKYQRIDLTIPKANFPENTLVYANQGSISQMKDGEAIYLEYVVLGQTQIQQLTLIITSSKRMNACFMCLYTIQRMVCFAALGNDLDTLR